jgi:hypothetical protein
VIGQDFNSLRETKSADQEDQCGQEQGRKGFHERACYEPV